jgi:hypothetical protein
MFAGVLASVWPAFSCKIQFSGPKWWTGKIFVLFGVDGDVALSCLLNATSEFHVGKLLADLDDGISRLCGVPSPFPMSPEHFAANFLWWR